MKVLITGIAGHLGSCFARWILDKMNGVEVYGIDDFSTGYRENVPHGVNLYPCVLGSNTAETPLNAHQYDYVFHFAAYAAEGLSPFIRCYNYSNNLHGTAQVVNACIRNSVRRLVFTSSMAVYGDQETPFYEDANCCPLDPYGNAKLASERDIQIAGEQHGLDWCIIRPHNVYGPYQDIWTPYRNVLGIWMARALRGEPMLIYGDGSQQRAFSYIDKVIPCLWQAATTRDASKQIINLGGKIPISIGEAASYVSHITGADIQYAEPRHEVKFAWTSFQKSEDILGYEEDEFATGQGVDAMWRWAQQAWEEYPQRQTRREAFSIEMEKGLYAFWKK